MGHGWNCYLAYVGRPLADQEERESDLGQGNFNRLRNTQK